MAIATIMLSTLGISSARAEGAFTTSMTQVQPQFDSRVWSDKNLDAVSTKVTLSNCKANAGGASPGTTPVASVTLALIKGSTVVKFITQKCGTYDFGRQGVGDYKFRVWAINGSTTKSRSVFLNASVYVSY